MFIDAEHWHSVWPKVNTLAVLVIVTCRMWREVEERGKDNSTSQIYN